MNEVDFYLSSNFLEIFSTLLNEDSKILKKKVVEKFMFDTGVDAADAVRILLASSIGFDLEDEEQYQIFKKFMKPSIKKQNIEKYIQNPYNQNIKPLLGCIKDIELTYEKYAPYELFVYDDLTDYFDLILPNIGFFDQSYKYLALKEKGRIWMLLTPNEMNTMEVPIDEAHGHVCCYGLGLGYFAYMVSRKENVSKVTIVEKNKDIIDIFKERILPYFDQADKIEIIEEDAYKFAKACKDNKESKYDFYFIDLWHDPSDGISMYLDFKKFEQDGLDYAYWIEPTLLIYLKTQIYLGKFDKITNKEQYKGKYLSTTNLKKIIKALK